MGLCYAITRNYLNNVCRGKEIKPPIVLQRGVSANKGIQRAFEEALNTKIIIPKYHMVMGAYGAALLAAGNNIGQTRFRGFDIANNNIITRAFSCEDCSNQCEIIRVSCESVTLGTSGGRCGKWEEQF